MLMSLCINSRRRAFSLPSPILLHLSDLTNFRAEFALSTDAEVTGVSRSRWSMVTRFGNVVLDTFWGFLVVALWMLPRPSSASSTMLHANKELQNLWSSLMQCRLKKVESQSQPGCLHNAFDVFALQTWLLYVAAMRNSLVWPKSHPRCHYPRPCAASLVHAHCWCRIPNQPEIASRSLFKGHTGNLPKKAK